MTFAVKKKKKKKSYQFKYSSGFRFCFLDNIFQNRLKLQLIWIWLANALIAQTLTGVTQCRQCGLDLTGIKCWNVVYETFGRRDIKNCLVTCRTSLIKARSVEVEDVRFKHLCVIVSACVNTTRPVFASSGAACDISHYLAPFFGLFTQV